MSLYLPGSGRCDGGHRERRSHLAKEAIVDFPDQKLYLQLEISSTKLPHSLL
jgi:hypothetical protein